MFQRIHDVLSGISRVATWIGGGALMLCAVMITGDVLCRKLLGISIGGSDEITAYVFSAATTWSFAYCLMHRTNIRIDAVYNSLPRVVRALIDLVSISMLTIFAGVLAERALDTLNQSIINSAKSITPLGTPMWIPQSVWMAGWVFFLITLIFVLLYILTSFVRGDLNTVGRVAGLLSVEEEILEETRGTGIKLPPRAGDDAC